GHAGGAELVLLPSVGLERDRLRGARLPPAIRSLRDRTARGLGGGAGLRAGPREGSRSRGAWADRRPGPMSTRHALRTLARGALRPPDNDSAFLLDPHRRAVPTERMARYGDDFEVDLAVVGAGA